MTVYCLDHNCKRRVGRNIDHLDEFMPFMHDPLDLYPIIRIRKSGFSDDRQLHQSFCSLNGLLKTCLVDRNTTTTNPPSEIDLNSPIHALQRDVEITSNLLLDHFRLYPEPIFL